MGSIHASTLDEAAQAVFDGVSETAGSVFRKLFSDTLDNAFEDMGDGTAFVLTGDIPAMWLRDSTAQLAPYLHFIDRDELLADTIAAVSRRQLRYLAHDPYANAFNAADNGNGHQADLAGQDGWVWERKYEVDSLCYPIQLAFDVWSITGRTDHLGDLPAAAAAAIAVIETEQQHEARSAYSFQRFDCPASDTLVRDGRGSLTAPVGLTWSAFRPSDDACELGFNIPGNAFAVVSLRQLAILMRDVFDDATMARRAEGLSDEIDAAIRAHGTVGAGGSADHLAYEVDGFGGRLAMDDANVPSLMSLPMLGWCAMDDPLYLRTREFALSDSNPQYFSGTAAAGVGSPHTPEGSIWPIAIAVQGLTTDDRDEKLRLLTMLLATDDGTGYMHESFDRSDPSIYTRPWFSWANAMFCELALDLAGLRSYRREPLAVESRS